MSGLSSYHVYDKALIHGVSNQSPDMPGLFVYRNSRDGLDLVEIYRDEGELWANFGSYCKPLCEMGGTWFCVMLP